jgi:hypothetical protein
MSSPADRSSGREEPGPISPQRIEQAIFLVRGHRIILDSELAALYGVPVKRLNEQVKRNSARFPPDFAFELTREEFEILRSQIATLRSGHGQHPKYLPRAFTEHGALMAASVLSSAQAVEMSVLVIRAFVRLRTLLSTSRQLAAHLEELESKYAGHDKQIAALFGALRELMAAPARASKRIGFESGTR